MYVLLIKIKKRNSFWGFWIKKDNFLRKPLPEQRAECRIWSPDRIDIFVAVSIGIGIDRGMILYKPMTSVRPTSATSATVNFRIFPLLKQRENSEVFIVESDHQIGLSGYKKKSGQ